MSLNSCSRIASGLKPFLTSMTRRSPFSRSVRSLTSAMPCSFLAWTSDLDPLDDLLRPDAVRQLGDDDALAARRDALDPGGRPHPEGAAAGLVGVAHPVEADDLAAGRQVRAGDEPHERVEVGARVGDEVPQRLDHLDEVVRRHVRGHPDRDAGGAVDEQVRDRGRAGPTAPSPGSRSSAGSRRCPRRSTRSSASRPRPSGTRCSASRRGRRRGSRSCRARRPSAAAATTAAPSGPARRRSRRRRAGGGGPSPRRRRGRTSRGRGRGAAPSRPSCRGSGAAPA